MHRRRPCLPAVIQQPGEVLISCRVFDAILQARFNEAQMRTILAVIGHSGTETLPLRDAAGIAEATGLALARAERACRVLLEDWVLYHNPYDNMRLEIDPDTLHWHARWRRRG